MPAHIAEKTFQNRKVRIVEVGAVQPDGKPMVEGWIRFDANLDQWVMTKATYDKVVPEPEPEPEPK
jgi:hypothetical protein